MTYGRSSARTCGALIMLLGVWGAIAPFVGPLFSYRMDLQGAWTWSTARAELSVGPGVIAMFGGLLLLIAGARRVQSFGGLMASVAGMWFVVGPLFTPLWGARPVGFLPGTQIGHLSATAMTSLEGLGLFYGTGVLIVALAAYGMGALAMLGVWRYAMDERAMAVPGKRYAPAAPPPPVAQQPLAEQPVVEQPVAAGPNPPVVPR